MCFIGLACVPVGLIHLLHASWYGIVERNVNRLMQHLQTGLLWLFTASLCHLPWLVGQWTNPNEKDFIEQVALYTVFILPVAVILFGTGWLQRYRGHSRAATILFCASLVTWLTVGWAQTVQLFGLVAITLFWQ